MNAVSLTKTGGTAMPEVLGPQNLSEVLALQDEVRAALPEGQKMFVLPQAPDYFEKFLARKNGLMVGMRSEGKLVAQIALMGPLTLEEAIDKNAITRNEVAFHHASLSESVVVAKSMAVHPSRNGNGLSQHLLQAALGQPLARVADHVFAQVSVDNTRSWSLFLRNGFGIVAAALDPQDKNPRFILQKPALGFAVHAMPSIDDSDPVADFSSIIRLTRHEALIGRPDAAGAKLAFYASSEAAASWYDKTVLGGA